MNFSVNTQFLTFHKSVITRIHKNLYASFCNDTLLKIHYYTKGLNNYEYTKRFKSNEVKEKMVEV